VSRKQCLVRLRAQDDVRRFHVHHPETFLPQLVRDQAGDAGEKFRRRPAFQPGIFAVSTASRPLIQPNSTTYCRRMSISTPGCRVTFARILSSDRPVCQSCNRSLGNVDRQRKLCADAKMAAGPGLGPGAAP